MTRRPFIPPEIRRALRSGALFVINHSGGKDSQAMTAVLRRIVPSHQLVVVYAYLPEVVWPDTEAHIRATTRGLEYHRVEADKTFFDLVEARGMFPSPRYERSRNRALPANGTSTTRARSSTASDTASSTLVEGRACQRKSSTL